MQNLLRFLFSAVPGAFSAVYSLRAQGKKESETACKPSSSNALRDLENENMQIAEDINSKLLKIREIKFLYEKTRIKPIFLFTILAACVVVSVIGYLENALTSLVGIVYPVYFSIKSIREKNRRHIKKWLQYWIIFSLFINLEMVFAHFLAKIKMYFFYKVVFLLICFLPQYNGSEYFYLNFVKPTFRRYEADLYRMSVTVATRIRNTLLEEE